MKLFLWTGQNAKKTKISRLQGKPYPKSILRNLRVPMTYRLLRINLNGNVFYLLYFGVKQFVINFFKGLNLKLALRRYQPMELKGMPWELMKKACKWTTQTHGKLQKHNS